MQQIYGVYVHSLAGEAAHGRLRQLLIGQTEVVWMYLSQDWNVLQPGLLQARLSNKHALMGAPHVRGQQFAEVPFGRDLNARIQSIQLST